jgi:hypothetical protein
MQMLSDNDLDLAGMSREQLDAAWDLWFDLAQTTNDADPPYSHGVFVGPGWGEPQEEPAPAPQGPKGDEGARV